MKEYFHYFKASDGADIEYVDVGAGKPMLFAHGFSGSAEMQIPMFERIKDKFRCISFTQRGYAGLSGISPGTCASGTLGPHISARDAKELLEHLGLENVNYIGYSMGATVLFAYVRQYGCTHLERAIIVDMTPKLINDGTWNHGLYQGHYTKEQYEKDLRSMEEDYSRFNRYFMTQVLLPHTAQEHRDYVFTPQHRAILEQVVKMSGIPGFTVDGLITVPRTMWAVNKAYWRGMGDNDFRDVLPKITVPVALLYARPGSIYDQGTAEYMHKNIPGATLTYSDDSTHFSMAAEKMENLIRLIKEFFA